MVLRSRQRTFTITGDAKLSVKDVFLDNITIKKVVGQTNGYENAENIRETNVRILELVKDSKAGR